MRYRTRSGKVFTDDQVVLDASRGLSRTGTITGFFVYLFNLLIGGISLVNKLLFRYKLGVRSYGLFTLLLAVVYIYATGIYHAYDAFVFDSAEKSITSRSYIEALTQYVWSFFLALFFPFSGEESYLFYEQRADYFGQDLTTVVMIFAVILLYLWNKLDDINLRKFGKKEELVHSLYRGESYFLSWFNNKKIGQKFIDAKSVALVGDTIIVALLVVWSYSIEYYAAAYTLGVSQIFLLLEDYNVYRQEKSIKFDFVDSQIDSAFMLEVEQDYNKRDESEISYTATINDHGGVGRKKRDFSESKFKAKILQSS